jgi:hypothetical protein
MALTKIIIIIIKLKFNYCVHYISRPNTGGKIEADLALEMFLCHEVFVALRLGIPEIRLVPMISNISSSSLTLHTSNRVFVLGSLV